MIVLEEGLKIARDEGCWVTVMKVTPNEGELHLTGIKDIEDIFMGGAKKSISEIRNIACSNRTLIKIRLEEGSQATITVGDVTPMDGMLGLGVYVYSAGLSKIG